MASLEAPAVDAFFGPPTLRLIREAAWAALVTRYTNYAAITVIAWDMLLTFSAEVELIWSSRIGLLKIIYLFNRYVTPVVLGVNIWIMSGNAKGLTDTVWVFHETMEQMRMCLLIELEINSCQNWFSVAFLVQLFCTVTVSLLIALRLWAWYEMSTRTLYLLLLVWLASFAAALTLMSQSLLVHRENVVHIRSFNICTSIYPVLWTQWLPGTVEHGIYFSFLILNAMATPRSARDTALAVLYREGIIFYSLTFTSMLTSLLVWRYASRLYIGLGLYTSWIVLQIAISRLLLDVRYSQSFRRKPSSDITPHGAPSSGTTHRRDHSRTVRTDQGRSRSSQSHEPRMSQSTSYPPTHHQHQKPERDTDSPSRSLSSPPSSGSASSSHRLESLFRRLWWLSPRWHTSSSSTNGDVYVDVSFDNDELPTAMPVEEGRGGLKVSRLGRYDEWL